MECNLSHPRKLENRRGFSGLRNGFCDRSPEIKITSKIIAAYKKYKEEEEEKN